MAVLEGRLEAYTWDDNDGKDPVKFRNWMLGLLKDKPMIRSDLFAGLDPGDIPGGKNRVLMRVLKQCIERELIWDNEDGEDSLGYRLTGRGLVVLDALESGVEVDAEEPEEPIDVVEDEPTSDDDDSNPDYGQPVKLEPQEIVFDSEEPSVNVFVTSTQDQLDPIVMTLDLGTIQIRASELVDLSDEEMDELMRVARFVADLKAPVKTDSDAAV